MYQYKVIMTIGEEKEETTWNFLSDAAAHIEFYANECEHLPEHIEIIRGNMAIGEKL